MKNLSKNLFRDIKKIWRKNSNIWFLVLAILGALIFRLFDYEKRTLWNVDQSLLFWQIKPIVVDHKISLIGLHFFSLLNGAVYRTSIFNWILAIPAIIFGFKVKVFIVFYTLIAIASLIFISKSAKILGGKIAYKFALLIYGFSWFIKSKEMLLWYASPMIMLSSAILWWMFATARKNTLKEEIILGLLIGLGFSLHFVVIWMIAGIVIYWFTENRNQIVKKILGISIGLAIMLLPLLIFNIRHDFIMKRGLINMITGSAVEDKASLAQRFSKANQEFTNLSNKTIGLETSGCIGLLVVLFMGIYNLHFADNKQKQYLVFSAIQLAVAYIGLIYAGRMDYSSEHYIHYTIPILVVIFSLFLSNLVHNKKGLISLSIITIYLSLNLNQFITFSLTDSYFYKKKLAEYLYSLPSGERIGVKFWDQEVVAYDFVFYETSRKLELQYEKMNLIERWGSDQADAYVYLNEKPQIKGKIINFGKNKLLLRIDEK